MAADVVALGAALVATKIATRPDGTGRRTYGSYRAEVFASGFTVLVMLGVSAYVVVEAVRRIGEDVEVSSGPMLVVGAIGLAINLVCLALLRGGAQESINVKGAYLEVMADAAGSVGVIAAGVLVGVTGSGLWDTVVAVAIGVFVAVRAVLLGREVLAVLGQHAPEGLDLDAVVRDLEGVAGRGGGARPARVDADVGDERRHRTPRHRRRRGPAGRARRCAGHAARGARHRARDAAGRGDPGPGVPRSHVVSRLLTH